MDLGILGGGGDPRGSLDGGLYMYSYMYVHELVHVHVVRFDSMEWKMDWFVLDVI